MESDSLANRGAAPGLPVDDAVDERPDASTAPFGIAEVLWAEDWQADVSPVAPTADGDAKSHPWRRGLRG